MPTNPCHETAPPSGAVSFCRRGTFPYTPAMIGFFDSGIGGLTVLSEFRKRFPAYDFTYFGDRANCPYGDKSDGEIMEFTALGVERLFEAGSEIVILACNTATVHAIRHLQQVRMPDRKILGVTIPGAERIVEAGYRHVGVLATEGTVRIKAYKERVHILDDSVSVHEIAAPELVPLIEKGIVGGPEIRKVLEKHVSEFRDIEALVLGCTHYPLVRNELEPLVPGVEIVDPGRESAKKFGDYLRRHPEIERRLSRGGKTTVNFSGDGGLPDSIAGLLDAESNSESIFP